MLSSARNLGSRSQEICKAVELLFVDAAWLMKRLPVAAFTRLVSVIACHVLMLTGDGAVSEAEIIVREAKPNKGMPALTEHPRQAIQSS